MKELQKKNFITKPAAYSFRKKFHDTFEETIILRNDLVHGSPYWKGKEHFNLMLVGGALEMEMGLKDKESGELWNLSNVLREICEPLANDLKNEGERMSQTLNNLVRVFLKITSTT